MTGHPSGPLTARVLTGAAVAMVAWTTALTQIVPRSAHITHWRATWVGFDVGLTAGLGATATFVARDDPRADRAFAALAALLIADAWFDTMTAHPGRDRRMALALAALVEVPTATLCTVLALQDQPPRGEVGIGAPRGRWSLP